MKQKEITERFWRAGGGLRTHARTQALTHAHISPCKYRTNLRAVRIKPALKATNSTSPSRGLVRAPSVNSSRWCGESREEDLDTRATFAWTVMMPVRGKGERERERERE
jgi:hypothetical protein